MAKGIRKIVSDTHFNHEKLVRQRGFNSVEEMNEHIIKIWNEKIKPNDKVIHLGDFAFLDDFKGIEEICKRLNGNITLVLGNHDSPKKVRDIYVKYFKCVGSLAVGKYFFTHEPVHRHVISQQFNECTDREAVINIHGHMHWKTIHDDKYINMCYDVLGNHDFIQEVNLDD